MALQNVIVIWLDGTFDGTNYQSMTNEFNENIASTSSSDSIDSLICKETKEDLVTNGASVITVQTPADAMRHIADNPTAKIFFISSGTLGKDMVPEIVRQYPQVHSFYIYCFKMVNHSEWALEYDSCLQMFDHQVDLLVRLMRDISAYFIKQGEMYLMLNDGKNALEYFEHALTLNIKANKRDSFNDPCRMYINKLNDHENQIGLIQQARDVLKQQQEFQE